jgi:uncharacterized membrane protein YhaH (DUF805 family)
VSGVFISYRRDVSSGAAGRLYDRLSEEIQKQFLFMDVDTIAPGTDFVKTIWEEIEKCNVFLVIIGPGWAAVTDPDGDRRLDNPNDYVRAELQAALARNIHIVPVLVDRARMPMAEELPDSLKELARRQAIELSHQRFSSDVRQLLQIISEMLPVNALRDTGRRNVGTHQVNPRGFAEILFGFRGRISRKTYWKYLAACSVVGALVGILLGVFLLVVDTSNGMPLEEAARKLSGIPTIDWRAKVLTGAFGTLMLWPLSAIILKRMHDFDQGKQLFSILVVIYVPALFSFWLGYDQVMFYVLVFLYTAIGIIGFVPGTPGDNRFGVSVAVKVQQSST